MKVEWKRERPSRAVLEVELPAEDVAREVGRAVARLARRVRVPGFRPGKAPRTVLERYIGREEVYGEAIEELVSSGYRQAVTEVGIVPVGRPEFDVPPLDEAKPLQFTARVDVSPEVDPGAYDTVRMAPVESAFAESEVDAAIEELRKRRSRLVSAADAKAAQGDFVLIRPTAVEGVDRFQVGREVLIELGAGGFPEPVETALTGAAAGDERTATLGESRLAATVVDVRRRELPALDDAFAKDVGAESLADLRARLDERLRAEADARARETYEEQVIAAIVDQAGVDLPKSMIDHEVEHLIGDLAESLQRRGFTLDTYLQQSGKDAAGLQEEMRPRAERRLKVRLVLDEIARREGLVPTQEEITGEEEKVAEELKQDLARVREWLADEGRREGMIAILRRRKTIAALVERARAPVGG
jgi:trigger factor